ncbi:hypothetical protein EIP86_003554 [Pleurotus ostreatoroseus]|nr:hypothetical protein EIP86_003554 [Pleurotus ostreatoroseus]
MLIDDIHHICNILCEFPDLLVEFSEFLPPNHTFKLSDDFERKHVVYITQDEKIAMRVASLVLVDSDIKGEAQRANEQAIRSKNDTYREFEHKQYLRVFPGSNTERQLLFQQLREAESSWFKVAGLVPKGQPYDCDDESWQQIGRLMIELGVSSNRVPTPFRVEGLQVNQSAYTANDSELLYTGTLEGKQVVVKRFRVFNAPITNDKKIKCQELTYTTLGSSMARYEE